MKTFLIKSLAWYKFGLVQEILNGRRAKNYSSIKCIIFLFNDIRKAFTKCITIELSSMSFRLRLCISAHKINSEYKNTKLISAGIPQAPTSGYTVGPLYPTFGV